jgi:hypothetical protein
VLLRRERERKNEQSGGIYMMMMMIQHDNAFSQQGNTHQARKKQKQWKGAHKIRKNYVEQKRTTQQEHKQRGTKMKMFARGWPDEN